MLFIPHLPIRSSSSVGCEISQLSSQIRLSKLYVTCHALQAIRGGEAIQTRLVSSDRALALQEGGEWILEAEEEGLEGI